jgi:thiamine biosynthesis lipoprotein
VIPEVATPVPPAIAGRTFHGFGTTVGTWTTDPTLVAPLDLLMREWVDAVESACSRFRADSDISRINAAAGTPVEVGPVLIDALTAAVDMARLTAGMCDPTLGVAVVSAGYDRTFEQIEAMGPGPASPAAAGGAWDRVEIDRAASTVMVPAGFALDLGGSAKGWAVDVALDRARRTLLDGRRDAGVCISAGGDLGVAGAAPGAGWPVTIRERLDGASGAGAEVFLRRGGVATSGATVRQWSRGGVRGHHIIDPRTGTPGRSPWSLVTIFADSCLLADVSATTAWLLGWDGIDWIETIGQAARLVDHDGREFLVGDISGRLAASS